MTELTPADVLADLFDSEDYLELTATDAATLVLKRLTDAGFEVRAAWPVPIVEDPADDEDIDFTLNLLCEYLDVDPTSVSWDAATETRDGDVSAVIGSIMRAKFGEDFNPKISVRAATIEECAKVADIVSSEWDTIARERFMRAGEASAREASNAADDCAERIRALGGLRDTQKSIDAAYAALADPAPAPPASTDAIALQAARDILAMDANYPNLTKARARIQCIVIEAIRAAAPPTISPHERCPAPDADPTSAPDTPFFECPGCGIDCANPSEQHKPSCPRGGWQMNLTDEQVMVGAKALMNTFIKKWFLGSYRGPVYLDCINGEMAWLDEARACLTAALPRADCGGGK